MNATSRQAAAQLCPRRLLFGLQQWRAQAWSLCWTSLYRMITRSD